jgi:hypothetical protein
MSVVATIERRLMERPAFTALPIELIRLQLRKKNEIVQQVCLGQLPLLEAAARFQSVSQPAGQGHLSHTDAEAVCRTLIAWVGLALADRPEQAATVTARLEAELELNLTRGAVSNS